MKIGVRLAVVFRRGRRWGRGSTMEGICRGDTFRFEVGTEEEVSLWLRDGDALGLGLRSSTIEEVYGGDIFWFGLRGSTIEEAAEVMSSGSRSARGRDEAKRKVYGWEQLTLGG